MNAKDSEALQSVVTGDGLRRWEQSEGVLDLCLKSDHLAQLRVKMGILASTVAMVRMFALSYLYGHPSKPLPCTPVRDLLADLPNLPKQIACVQFAAGNTPTISMMFHELDPVYGHYRNMAQKFLSDLARYGNSQKNAQLEGEAVIVLNDDSTLPVNILESMLMKKVPLLAHSIRGADKAKYALLIPDYHFIEHHGFARLESYFRQQRTKFKNRSPVVFWRGSTTGETCLLKQKQPNVESEVQTPCHCFDLPRVQSVNMSRNIPWLDIALTRTVQLCADHHNTRLLEEYKLMAEEVDEKLWPHNRGILEIDGNVNAWGNRWRTVSGSVLFRVESDFINSYNLCQQAWVHFVPISRNLSNLISLTSMVQSEDSQILQKLESIATNANRLGSFFTYREEIRRVFGGLSDIWSDKLLQPLNTHCNKVSIQQ